MYSLGSQTRVGVVVGVAVGVAVGVDGEPMTKAWLVVRPLKSTSNCHVPVGAVAGMM